MPRRLIVPRRPPWASTMSPDQLEEQERKAFFDWRRELARCEAYTAADCLLELFRRIEYHLCHLGLQA